MPNDGSLGGTNQQLIRFRASDGFLVNALFLTGDEAVNSRRDRPMLLQVHGSLGHFLARGTPGRYPMGSPTAAFTPCLSIPGSVALVRSLGRNISRYQ